MNIKLITIKKFAELTGYTENAIRSKINRGDWLENIVWKRAPDNRTLSDLDGYYMWVDGSTRGSNNG